MVQGVDEDAYEPARSIDDRFAQQHDVEVFTWG